MPWEVPHHQTPNSHQHTHSATGAYLGGQNDVGTSGQNLLNLFLGDVRFALTDGLQLLGVLDKHLDAELHAVLLQVEVQQGDLGTGDQLRHGLGRTRTVQREAPHQLTLGGGAAVGLQDVDGLDGVGHFAVRRFRAHRRDGIHRKVGEKVGRRANNLGGHARLGGKQALAW